MKTKKTFLGLILMGLIVGTVACGGGNQRDWRDRTVQKLEESNCFANGDEVTCDVRSCALDCKVYVEQDGEFQGVVGLCPDQETGGHTVSFTNDFTGPIDVLCRRGRSDEPKILAEGLGDASLSSSDGVLSRPAGHAGVSEGNTILPANPGSDSGSGTPGQITTFEPVNQLVEVGPFVADFAGSWKALSWTYRPDASTPPQELIQYGTEAKVTIQSDGSASVSYATAMVPPMVTSTQLHPKSDGDQTLILVSYNNHTLRVSFDGSSKNMIWEDDGTKIRWEKQ